MGAERGERRLRRVIFLRLIFAGAAFRRFARLGLVFGRFAFDRFFGSFGFLPDFFFFAIRLWVEVAAGREETAPAGR